MARYTRQDIDNKFESFVNQMLMLRLINSGKSSLSDQQDKLVKNAFDIAYEILVAAKDRQDAYMFNRVSKMAYEIVPSDEVKTVMKHPEMYETMRKAKGLFYAKVYELLGGKTSYPFMPVRAR